MKGKTHDKIQRDLVPSLVLTIALLLNMITRFSAPPVETILSIISVAFYVVSTSLFVLSAIREHKIYQRRIIMTKEQVFDTLMKAEDMMDAKAIVEATGLERKDVDKAITALKKEGKIESPKRCFYAAVK